MTKFILRNGYTKAKLINYINDNFKGKSTHANGSCFYRGDDGRKCAVGLFIPDINYRPYFEGLTAYKLIEQNSFLKKFMPLGPKGMTAMQQIHDYSFPEQTLQNLIEFAQYRTTVKKNKSNGKESIK